MNGPYLLKRLCACIAAFVLPVIAFAQAYHWEPSVIYPGYSGRFGDTYFLDKDTGFVISDGGKIFKTYNGGNLWDERLSSSGIMRSIEFCDNGQYGIAGALNNKVYRTTDRGETWSDISSSIPDTNKKICGLTHAGNNIFCGVGWWGSEVARFFKSTDAGQSWQVTHIDTSLATCLVDIAALDAQTIFASGGKFTANERRSVVLKSADGGNSWSTVFSDDMFGGRIWKLQFLTNDLAYGSVEPYFYPDTVCVIKTTDGGQHWNMIHIGKSQNTFDIGTQMVGFVNPKVGWVGGWYPGLFETVDSGKTWNYMAPPEAYNMNRGFRVNDSTFYTTTGSGVMRYMPGWNTQVPGTHMAYSSSHTLYPPTPNPAFGKIRITFDLGKASNMALEIMDLNGHHYKRIDAGFMEAGSYMYYWDGTNYPPGNYMVWLGTDEIPLIQRFVLTH